ncbi:hypothetical protein HanHA300_Chr16g0624861 [Helianthus annuus]|nr:hypothetical protein HanHA300_Chr16g0624861 [Helianthus annuus]
MVSNTQPDPYTLPKLPLFSTTPHHHPEPSGTLTPPHHATASIPFQWETQPGKPRPCTDIIISSTHNKCLELPPRLVAIVEQPKTCSPTTVLDGKTVFSSASFRFAKERRRRGQMQGSFDSNCSGGWSPNDDNGCLGQVDDKSDRQKVGRENRQFGSFRLLSGSRKVISMDGGFSDENKMRRNSSLSKVTRSHFWATVYKGFKQVVPWRKKTNKESFIL